MRTVCSELGMAARTCGSSSARVKALAFRRLPSPLRMSSRRARSSLAVRSASVASSSRAMPSLIRFSATVIGVGAPVAGPSTPARARAWVRKSGSGDPASSCCAGPTSGVGGGGLSGSARRRRMSSAMR